jgi:putative hemolysin
VIATLWSALARHVRDAHVDDLFGCASIGLADGRQQARAVMALLSDRYLSHAEHRVKPYRVHISGAAISHPRLPPLVKAYIGLGARACGEAYWDRDFDCLDVFMLLEIALLNARYRRHFMHRDDEALIARAA